MAIQANAVKGGMSIPQAYILVTLVKMEKYLRPTMDANGKYSHDEVFVQHSAKFSLYTTEAERVAGYGQSDFNFYLTFEHTEGEDPTQEAYEAIKAQGIPGWSLTKLTDV